MKIQINLRLHNGVRPDRTVLAAGGVRRDGRGGNGADAHHRGTERVTGESWGGGDGPNDGPVHVQRHNGEPARTAEDRDGPTPGCGAVGLSGGDASEHREQRAHQRRARWWALGHGSPEHRAVQRLRDGGRRHHARWWQRPPLRRHLR